MHVGEDSDGAYRADSSGTLPRYEPFICRKWSGTNPAAYRAKKRWREEKLAIREQVK
jgi:hypothetical protein